MRLATPSRCGRPQRRPSRLPRPCLRSPGALTFTGAEGGDLTLKHGETTLTANEGRRLFLHALRGRAITAIRSRSARTPTITMFPRPASPSARTRPQRPSRSRGPTRPPSLPATARENLPSSLTAAELRAFANKVNSGDSAAAHAYVKLTDNIIVPGSWTPLGKNAASRSAAILTATATASPSR